MSIMKDSTIFIIDGSKAISGTGASFEFAINMPRGKNYNRVCLLQAIIPKSYFLCTTGENTFILSENGTNTTVTVTQGSYNAISWITLIGTLLTNSSTQGWTYTITLPNPEIQVDTAMFTYSCTGGAGTQPIIIFPATSLLYEQFGFSAGSSNSFVGGTLISTNVLKFQVEDCIFVHSSISHNEDQSSQNDVLQEIYASSTPNWTNIIYQNSGAVEAYSKRLLSANNNIYSFSLTDELENPMNLHGLYPVFTIVVYEADNINDLIARDLLQKVDRYKEQMDIYNQMLRQFEKQSQLLENMQVQLQYQSQHMKRLEEERNGTNNDKLDSMDPKDNTEQPTDNDKLDSLNPADNPETKPETNNI